MKPTNNPPYKIVSLTKEQYDFVLHNIETNMIFGLAALQQLKERTTQEKMVALLEQFKDLKKAFEAAD